MKKRSSLFLRCFGAVIFYVAYVAPWQADAQSPNASSPNDQFAVVEIGASGVKTSILQMTPREARQIEKDFAFDQDPIESQKNFKYDLVDNKGISEKKITETKVFFEENLGATIAEVSRITQLLHDKYAILKENIYVLASSGVSSTPQAMELRRRLTEIFPEKQLAFLNATEECSAVYRWIVPKNRYKEAVVIDVGSGNVKACYMENAGSDEAEIKGFELLDLGTVAFAKKVEDFGAKKENTMEYFIKNLEPARQKFIDKVLSIKSNTYPRIVKPTRLYMVGGIVWLSSTLVRPLNFRENWILIAPNDFIVMRNRIKRGTWDAVDPNRILSEEKRRAYIKEVDRMRGIFNEKQMLAGIELLIAMSKALEFPEVATTKRAMFFASRGFEGLRFQFLLDRIAEK